MGAHPIRVERISTAAEFDKFAKLPFDAYAARDAWWPPDVQAELELLSGKSPIAKHLEMAPMWARRGDRVLARVSAVLNHRYNRHWNETLGQLIHFEALPDEREAAVALLAEASEWLKSRGMAAVRSGFAAFLDYPYAIDNYGRLPAFLLRGNPAHYHSYFKNAGFETEKGLSDYTAPLDDANLQRYQRMVSGTRAGVSIQSWREYGFSAAIDAWTDVTNAAFARHWGWNPVTRGEVQPMLMALASTPVADLSVIASAGAEAIGAVFSVPDLSTTIAKVRPGFVLSAERGEARGALINIGVLENWRGCGVNLAMAARSFTEMAEQGMRFAGYTLVVDDNWRSRGTARKLGAHVTSNFVAYRKEL